MPLSEFRQTTDVSSLYLFSHIAREGVSLVFNNVLVFKLRGHNL